MDHREEIRKYLGKFLAPRGRQQSFSYDASLLRRGRLASGNAVDIVVFLKEKVGVTFSEIGFDQTLIDSVDTIDSLIQTLEK
jgi:hypothetical protein